MTQTTLLQTLNQQLRIVEDKLAQAKALLIEGEAMGLANASTELQTLAVQLVQSRIATELLQPMPADMVQRFQAISTQLTSLRDNLSRRAAYNEQALHTVLPPAAPEVTYSANGSTLLPPSPFSPIAPQSGTLEVLSA